MSGEPETPASEELIPLENSIERADATALRVFVGSGLMTMISSGRLAKCGGRILRRIEARCEGEIRIVGQGWEGFVQ